MWPIGPLVLFFIILRRKERSIERKHVLQYILYNLQSLLCECLSYQVFYYCTFVLSLLGVESEGCGAVIVHALKVCGLGVSAVFNTNLRTCSSEQQPY